MFTESDAERFHEQLDSIETWDQLPYYVKNASISRDVVTPPLPKKVIALGTAGVLAFIGIMGWWVHDSKAPSDTAPYTYPDAPATTDAVSPSNLPSTGQPQITIQNPNQTNG